VGVLLVFNKKAFGNKEEEKVVLEENQEIENI